MPAPAHIFKTARRQLRKIRHRGPGTDTERRLVASADQQRADGLGWRYEGFGDYADEELFQLLSRIALELDEASFRREAVEAGSPTVLGERWQSRARAEGKWGDLPGLAARELWRRLLPEYRAPEVVADVVDELLERAEVSEQAPTLWLEAAQRLITGCHAEGAGDREFFAAVRRESGADLSGWMVEMPAALLGTADAHQAPELCGAFAELVDPKALLAERAELLALLGRREEAIAQIEQLLAEHPGEAIVLLKAGGTYEALNEPDAAQRYLRRYTELMRHPSSAPMIAEASRNGVPLRPVARAPEPNERCSCGSGKKFKRCHGLPS